MRLWPSLFVFPLVFCQASRKNVLFLAVDDLRPQINTLLNSEKKPFLDPTMHTPYLDKLVRKSLVLMNAHVQYPVCNPSRTSAMTSRRPDTTHVYDLDTYWREVAGNFTSIPQYFKEHGYESIGMGKIYHPGEDTGDNDPPSWSRDFYRPRGSWGNNNHSWVAVPKQNYTEDPLPDMQIRDKALETLRDLVANPVGKPFFLAVGFQKPHLPFTFPEEYLDYYREENISLPENPYAPVDMPSEAWSTYGELRGYGDVKALNLTGEINTTLPDYLVKDLRRAYYASVTYIDAMIGEVMKELDDLGLTNDTIISLWGDHGFQLGEHGEWCKHTNFELSSHVPLMIHVPGLTDHGVKSFKMTELVDLFPTLVEAAGLPQLDVCPENSSDVTVCTEGASLLPLLNGSDVPWKSRVFMQVKRGNTRMGYSMRSFYYRYTEWVGFKDDPDYAPDWDDLRAVELYDHNDDWLENVNRANDPAYQEIVEQHQKYLHRGWRDAWPTEQEDILLPKTANTKEG